MINLNNYLAKPDKTVREHTDELIESAKILYNYGYITEKDYKLLELTCEYHDYGKINHNFQTRVKSRGKIKFDSEKEVSHNVLSLTLIEKEKFKSEEDYIKTCYAILNHHHHTNNYKEMEKRELMKDFSSEFGGKLLKRKPQKQIKEQEKNIDSHILKGLLHKCDYSASGNFIIEYPNNFLEDSLENLNYNWNELQEFCIENRDENLIVVANTGMGKTEAGLLWIGNNKGFFILPLRTAINSIYKRIREGIVKENLEERVALMHSDTLSLYLKEAVTEKEKMIEYAKRGKQFNMPLSISTLDQIFNFVYKYNVFELKLATLSYSKLVIDEIQAYSPDLLAYLVYGLEMINKVGGKFAILTATLPPFVRDLIEENIGKVKSAKFTKGEDRHHIKIIEEKIDVELIRNHYKEKGGKILIICNTVKESQRVYDELREEFENELNVLHSKFIKRDRSKKEKDIEEFGKTESSKFYSKDVKVVKGNKNGIWIATSVVEASLDIDFDFLFTELNDLNGLFQRLGRVNRKGKKREMLTNPNVYLFTEIEDGLFIRGSGENKKGIIDRKIYELSKEAIINQKNGVLSENRKVELIEEYLTTEKIKSSSFFISYNEMKSYIENLYLGEKTLKETQKMFRNIGTYNAIPKEIYNENREILEEKEKICNKIFEKDETLTDEENKKRREEFILEQKEAREEIYSYTLSVRLYDLNKTGKVVSDGFEEIPVIECNYSVERGFERIKEEGQKEDNFF